MGGKRELGGIGRVHDPRQQRVAEDDAQNGADPAGKAAVEHELERHVSVVVTEGLERARTDALLLDHARHGRERHESCGEIKKDREDIGERVHDLGDRIVGLVGLGAEGLAARVGLVAGQRELGQAGTGIGQVGLAVRDLLQRAGQGVVVFGEFFLVGLLAVGVLRLALGVLTLCGGDLRLGGGPAARELGDAGAPRIHPVVVGREARLVGLAPGGVGRLGLRELGSLAAKKCLGVGDLCSGGLELGLIRVVVGLFGVELELGVGEGRRVRVVGRAERRELLVGGLELVELVERGLLRLELGELGRGGLVAGVLGEDGLVLGDPLVDRVAVRVELRPRVLLAPHWALT